MAYDRSELSWWRCGGIGTPYSWEVIDNGYLYVISLLTNGQWQIMSAPFMTLSLCKLRRYILSILLFLTCFGMQVNGKKPLHDQNDRFESQTGMASWYGGHWIGRLTANGERYRAGDLTAAHRQLPFGTFVRVTNLNNNRSAIVRINNRGPFAKGKIIDLSKRAATDLAMLSAGTTRVRLEVLSGDELDMAKVAVTGSGGS
jgi:rare lipoprotein A